MWNNTTQSIASKTDSRYETPGGAKQKADEALIQAKQYSDEMAGVVQGIETNVMTELTQITSEMVQISAAIDEVKSGGVVPPNMVTFEAWNGGESVVIGDTPVTPVEPTPDTTAPIVNASIATGSYTSAISVILSSNEGVIYYTTNGAEPSTSSAVYTSPITLSATTVLKFFGRDAAGNSSAVQTRTYTITIATPDTTAPNNVTGLTTSNVTQTTLTLSWTASPSSDVAGYEIHRNGTLLTTVTGTTYAATGLSANTAYTFMVKAKDASGNIATGTSVTVTTIADESGGGEPVEKVESDLLYYVDNPAQNTVIPNPSDYFTGTKLFTLSVTFNPVVSGSNAANILVSRFGMGLTDNVMKLEFGWNNAITAALYGKNADGVTASNPQATSTSTYTDYSQFYHIVMVRDNTKLLLYVNNVLSHSLNMPSTDVVNQTSASNLVIGQTSKTGVFKNVAYYSRVLTPEELTQNYNALK